MSLWRRSVHIKYITPDDLINELLKYYTDIFPQEHPKFKDSPDLQS
jgi:hypothetical protein